MLLISTVLLKSYTPNHHVHTIECTHMYTCEYLVIAANMCELQLWERLSTLGNGLEGKRGLIPMDGRLLQGRDQSSLHWRWALLLLASCLVSRCQPYFWILFYKLTAALKKGGRNRVGYVWLPVVHELCHLLCYHRRSPRPALACQSSVLCPAEDLTRNSTSCGDDVFFCKFPHDLCRRLALLPQSYYPLSRISTQTVRHSS